MTAPDLWTLPTAASVNGRRWPIHSDYRDVLDVIAWLNGAQGGDLPPEERWYVAMSLFYPDFPAMPRQDWPAASDFMAAFLAGGRPQAAGLAAGRPADRRGGQPGGGAGRPRPALPALVELSGLL